MKKCPVCGSNLFQGKCVRWPVCGFEESIINTMPEQFVSFDLETTGFSRKDDRVIEIGAVRMRLNKSTGKYDEVDSFSCLVNPGKGSNGNQIFITPYITQLTGISNEMVANQIVESEAVLKFVEWCKDDIVAGHNIVKFDIPFLKAAVKRAGAKWSPNSCMDSLQLAGNLQLKEKGFVPNLKQPTLADWLGFKYNAHRAVDDCRACSVILQKLGQMAEKQKITIVSSC